MPYGNLQKTRGSINTRIPYEGPQNATTNPCTLKYKPSLIWFGPSTPDLRACSWECQVSRRPWVCGRREGIGGSWSHIYIHPYYICIYIYTHIYTHTIAATPLFRGTRASGRCAQACSPEGLRVFKPANKAAAASLCSYLALLQRGVPLNL